MLKLSDEAKAKYAKYIDANGRLIVDDSLPEDVKKAFNYFNNKGINIMELNIDDDIIDLPEEEPEDIDDDIGLDSDEDEEFDFDNSFEENDENVNLDNLNDLF